MQGMCFALKARRVLVVVPTDALRRQALKAFQTLDTLRRLKTLPPIEDVPSPITVAANERVTSEQAWFDLAENANVVVATPGTASAGIPGIVAPPQGMFDLVVVDEGHHSPARTWKSVIDSTSDSKHVLLSATPFRRDRLQLPGKLIFFYPLKKAVQEKAFGLVRFVPIDAGEDASSEQVDDELIDKAVDVYRRDRDAGFEHRALIRTDKVISAEALAEKYRDAGLKVRAVSSRLGKASIAQIEEDLQSGELDGVVCVDMFGEGYDFPKFKIAVLHVAHRSLVPTLQFIGRFARTNDEKTGEATFIGFPSGINSESDELYKGGVDWEVLLADIADAQQLLSIKDKKTLESFDEIAKPNTDYEAVNPGNIRLPRHLACFSVTEAPDFDRLLSQVRTLKVANTWISDNQDACVLLFNELRSSPWVIGTETWDSVHECVLLRYYPESNFLFITSTRKAGYLYTELLEHFVSGAVRPLNYSNVRRVLNGLNSQEFFSVGIRNNSPVQTTESYRIVAGSQADRGIRDADVAGFSQGHFFGRGEIRGDQEIIGASAGGRVWSNGKDSIPGVMKWMDELHARIVSREERIGPSGLDRLSYGRTLEDIPTNTFAADWSQQTYRKAPRFRWSGDHDARRHLLDLDIKNVSVTPNQKSVCLSMSDDHNRIDLRYDLSQLPHWNLVSDQDAQVEEGGHWIPLCEWLSDYPLTFFTTEFSAIVDGMIVERRMGTELNGKCLQTMSWDGCERRVEFDLRDPDRPTVQKFLQDKLIQEEPDFLIYDHRSGEAADYISGKFVGGEGVEVRLYHCKGATGDILSSYRQIWCIAIKQRSCLIDLLPLLRPGTRRC